MVGDKTSIYLIRFNILPTRCSTVSTGFQLKTSGLGFWVLGFGFWVFGGEKEEGSNLAHLNRDYIK